MQSQANTDGNMTTTVTFKLGTDPDKAQQLVQNRVSQALPRLPDDVQRLGVTTHQGVADADDWLVHLISPNNRYDMDVSAQLRADQRQGPARTDPGCRPGPALGLGRLFDAQSGSTRRKSRNAA